MNLNDRHDDGMLSVIWHDLECGRYAQDLPLWRSLADEFGGPVLDVGAGTGRVTLDLARLGHRVTALDRDRALLTELRRRAGDLEIETVAADAREFELPQRYSLCVVPMQTIQLLGGARERARFLRQAKRHLLSGGIAAIAITEVLDLFDVSDGAAAPLPDMRELGGVLYASHPTAVRADGDGFLLERHRETVAADGARSISADRIRLDRVSAYELEEEALSSGLIAFGRRVVAPTADHVGSEVVLLRA